MYAECINILSQDRVQSNELNKAVELLIIMDLKQIQKLHYKLIYDFIEFVNCCTDTGSRKKDSLEYVAQYIMSQGLKS